MDAGVADDQLAVASPRALEVMLITHGHKFPAGVWGLTVDELRHVMKRAEPTWIFFALPREDEAGILEPYIDSGGESPSKLQASLLSLSAAASVVMSPHEPSLLGVYSGIVATLGFTFATYMDKWLDD